MMGLFLEVALFSSGLIRLHRLRRAVRGRSASRMRWRRIYALAKLSFKEAVRRRVVWVFLLILILYLFPARWFFREKPEDELKSIVGVTTRGMNVLLIAVGLLLAAFSIPSDIKNLTIHTIVTKPVERFEIVLGRFLGYLGLITWSVLAIMTGFGLVLINAGNVSPEEAAAEYAARASPGMASSNSNRRRRPTSSAWTWAARTVTASTSRATTSQRAVWNFISFPDRFDDARNRSLSSSRSTFTGRPRATEGTGMQVTFEVVSHTWDADRRIDDPANPACRSDGRSRSTATSRGLSNVSPRRRGQVGQGRRPGRAVWPIRVQQPGRSLIITRRHCPVPGGVFRNANKGDASRARQADQGRPVQVQRRDCRSASVANRRASSSGRHAMTSTSWRPKATSASITSRVQRGSGIDW